MSTKWERRERKRHKKKNGMRISGRSIFILEEQKVKRAGKLNKKRKKRRRKK